MLYFIVFIHHVMVYVLNSDNCCYLLSSFLLLDDVSMTSFALVYSSLLIMVFSKEDRSLIKNVAVIERLRCEKVY